MDCTHSGTQATTLQGAADAFFQDALCTLSPGNAGCTPPATPTSTPTATATTTPNPCASKPDGTTCDAGTSAKRTCEGGACGNCVPQTSPSPRFVDNGDGTVTDRKTCLVWEKKTTAVNSRVNFARAVR